MKIRKKLKYNSDYMSEKMDSYMEQIEDKLSALYANASYEINKKFAEFTQGFEKQDANMLAQVEAGKITEEEYGQWRNRHIVQSNQYKSTVDEISTMLVNTDVAAMAMVNDAMPMVVAQSYNFTEALGFEAAQKAGLTQGTFQVYNARSVQRIIKDNPNLLKEVNEDADKDWNREKVNREIVQGMVQGESIPKISERIQRVTNMDENAATRNARTAMTAAENMGRAEAADDLKKQGIPMDEVWSATYDNRTRESHLELDGTVRDENGYFGADFLAHPLRYPADPLGDPEEIYNCRCRLSLQIKGIDHSKDQELYENFMKDNFPETWENLQANEKISASLETYSKKQEEMPPRPTRDFVIPAPEKISLEDAKEEFIPAKTIQEAEEYASRFAENVDYSRLSVDKANQINETLTNLTEKYPIKPLEEIKQKGGSQAASANFKHLYVNGQKMGKNLDEEYENFLLKQEQMRQTIEDIKGRYPEGRIPQIMQNKIDDLENKLQFERWGVLDSYPNKIDALITHEYGHIIADQYFVQNSESSRKDISHFTYQPIKEEWKSIYKQAYSNGDIYKMSEYAGTNEKEYFAECFAARELGETIPDYVEDFMKRRVDNGKPL